jgi:hypothetical protein
MNRRCTALSATVAAVIALSGCAHSADAGRPVRNAGGITPADAASTGEAMVALDRLPVKGRAPKTGYARSQFGVAWTDDNGAMWGHDSLSTREDILSRDLSNVACKARSAPQPPCVVQTGVLHDPYTATEINFVRGEKTSPLVPIDHVVSLGDSWQKGAQQLSPEERINLANDPLNLIATTQAPNSAKSDGDAATWLPGNKAFRCTYVARQIAVKLRYRLWVTAAEKDAISGVLSKCPGQPLPSDAEAAARTA